MRIIFHVDVNNAFLSWTAIYLLKNGYERDIRLIPSVIGGDEKSRHGIVLAKSTPAKKLGILSAEPIFLAKKKRTVTDTTYSGYFHRGSHIKNFFS